jgi:hypothetical protein
VEPDADALAVAMNAGLPVNVAVAGQQRILGKRAAFQPAAWQLAADTGGPLEGLTFLDEKGHPLPTRVSPQTRVFNNTMIREYVLRYSTRGNLGEPAKLIYNASRTRVIEVPFTLHDVKLP